ncbi:BatD family protein [Arenicella xantha]|uniref:Oxygen tolerance protein BatD n=1 Tax=Arenicella xantha TaxID=644221 RepID=A0A395JKH1_9GAMM|nr:BatD family protein [Arenicella xantha]RBP51286.1 oxygen tolerance protein BatD [Arenicella xantha]
MKQLHSYLRLFGVGLLLSCCCVISVQAATLSSTVNRNELGINQTLVLTVIYDDQVDSSAIDVSSLVSDFDVLGVSPQTSSSMTIVNGVTENNSTTRWSITLAPKREGKLQIPSFTIGSAKSQPISISVSDTASTGSTTAANQPLAVSVSVEPDSVYADQQFILKVQLVVTQNLSDLGGSQLSIEGGDIQPLGQQTYQQVDNGIATQVVELRYAIFPQKAGDLTIPSLRYTGVLGGRRSIFDSFGMRGEQVIARSQPITVAVKPKSERANASWFPASEVAVDSSWSSDISQLKVGQPVTRTITITAQNQRSSVIPPLPSMLDSSYYKSYQDQPQLSDEVTEQGIIGTRIESQAIVASTSGELRLPEIRIPWWNTQTGEWEDAVVPEQVLVVAADDVGLTASGSEPGVSISNTSAAQQAVADQTESVEALSNLVWIAVVSVLALIIALQFFVIIRLNKQLTAIREHPMSVLDEQDLSAEEAWSVVLDQLKKEDPSGTRLALTHWLRIALQADNDTPLTVLLATLNDDQLSHEVARLDRTLYQHGEGFNPDQLATAALAVRDKFESDYKGSTKSALPPLYPS